jgi:hypothetical protein
MLKSNATINGLGKIFTPGSYIVQAVNLYPRDPLSKKDLRLELNIYPIITDFEINESLYSPVMEVVFSIEDATNLLEEYKLFGDEKIQLIILKPTQDEDQETEKLIINLRIAEIANYVKRKPGAQFYQFRCVREHVYNNNSKLLVRPFSGTISSVCSKILKTDLSAKIGKISASSKNVINGVFPSIKPLNALLWLTKNAYDEGTPFYVYETMKDGLNFRSYKNMIQDRAYDTYNNFAFLLNKSLGSKEQNLEEKRKIMKVSTDSLTSKLADISSGAYASSLYAIDISNKEFLTATYKHKSKNVLNKNKPFSVNSELGNREYDTAYASKNYYVSLNKGNNKNYHEPHYISILEAESHRENMNFMSHEITINGDLDLSVGMKIEVLFSKSTDTERANTDDMVDKFNSGNYIITEIRHIFQQKYIQILKIKKDSW